MIIGILGRPKKANEREYNIFSKGVTDVIIKYDSIPLGIIPPVTNVLSDIKQEEVKKICKLIDLCDGIILQGGSDFYQYDIEAIKYILEKDIPVLGICLGMQSITAAYGASLTDVSNHKKDGIPYVHDVILNENSKLYKIMKKNKIEVNSRHEQQIINPLTVQVSGLHDNVIEAVEVEEKTFCIGVQWHPEDMIEYDEDSKKLFDSFFLSCQNYAKNK